MPKKIKVLHFTSSLKMGGAEAVLCDLISSMDKDSFEHVVFYVHDGPHRECLANLGVPYYQISYNPLFFIRLIWRIQKINPDVIHTLLWVANLAGRIAGALVRIPVVSAWHNNLDQDGAVRNFFDKATYGLSVQQIAVSQGVAESAARLGFGNVNKIRVITNGINIARLKAQATQTSINRAALGLSPEHFVVGSVGRFMPVKRYDLMLEAFALLHTNFDHVRLVLVGIGDLENTLRAQAEQLAIAHAVIFIVGKPSASYYPLFDCFSLSSDKEGVSIALLEAMSFGLACVVTHSDKDHAVIEQGINGIYVNAGDKRKLADAWQLLIKNKETTSKLGITAYERVQERFSSQRMCAEYEAVFRRKM